MPLDCTNLLNDVACPFDNILVHGNAVAVGDVGEVRAASVKILELIASYTLQEGDSDLKLMSTAETEDRSTQALLQAICPDEDTLGWGRGDTYVAVKVSFSLDVLKYKHNAAPCGDKLSNLYH